MFWYETSKMFHATIPFILYLLHYNSKNHIYFLVLQASQLLHFHQGSFSSHSYKNNAIKSFKLDFVCKNTYYLWKVNGWIHLPLTDGPSVKFVWYKTIFFSSEFNETWWSWSTLCVPQLHQVSINSDEKQNVLYRTHLTDGLSGDAGL